MLCIYLGTKHIETTAYHRQTKGQVERFNKLIVARLAQFVTTHQRIRELFRYLKSYTYHTRL